MTDAGVREALLAVDVATGRVLAERDLADDVAAELHLPRRRPGRRAPPAPGGGATLVFDASPTEVPEDRIPTLLRYDAELQPVRGLDAGDRPVRGCGDPVGGRDRRRARCSCWPPVEDGSWLLAVPDGGGAGPLLAQLDDRVYGYALTVEPAQVWAVLPSPVGVRAVDLTTGEALGPLGFECYRRLDVRALYPAEDGAIAIGECDSPRADTQLLWFLAS